MIGLYKKDIILYYFFMKKSILENQLQNLPQTPGVYFFRDAAGKILYIGKATNLKSRVASYFRGARTARPIETMIHEVADIAVEETDSVLEALILESNLIKKQQPKYNVKEKDDKSFAYFVITKEEFPRVLIMRKTNIDAIQNSAVFGPYTSKYQMQVALKIMRRIFPFHALKQKSEKGCLDFQLGLCPGPYAGAISREEYRKNIRAISLILQGKKKRLLSSLEKEMILAAKGEEFEKAANLRNQIFALQHIRDVALMSKEFEDDESRIKKQESRTFRIEAYDISNISGTSAVGSMVVFENGNPDKNQYRKFKIKTVEGSNDVGMMHEVLLRRFKNDWPMPDLVLLDGGQGHVNMADQLLHKELGLAVDIVGVAKGPTRKNQELRIMNYDQNSKFMIHDSKIRKDEKNKIEAINDVLEDKFLLKFIMDEAHRFAITYHRKVRAKKALE